MILPNLLFPVCHPRDFRASRRCWCRQLVRYCSPAPLPGQRTCPHIGAVHFVGVASPETVISRRMVQDITPLKPTAQTGGVEKIPVPYLYIKPFQIGKVRSWTHQYPHFPPIFKQFTNYTGTDKSGSTGNKCLHRKMREPLLTYKPGFHV